MSATITLVVPRAEKNMFLSNLLFKQRRRLSSMLQFSFNKTLEDTVASAQSIAQLEESDSSNPKDESALVEESKEVDRERNVDAQIGS